MINSELFHTSKVALKVDDDGEAQQGPLEQPPAPSGNDGRPEPVSLIKDAEDDLRVGPP